MSCSSIEFANRPAPQENIVPPSSTPVSGVGPRFAPNRMWCDLTDAQRKEKRDMDEGFIVIMSFFIFITSLVELGVAVGVIENGWEIWVVEASFVIITLFFAWRAQRDYEAVFHPKLYPSKQDDFCFYHTKKYSVHNTPESRAIIIEKFKNPATSFTNVREMLHGWHEDIEKWRRGRQLNFGPLVRHGYMTQANAEAMIALDDMCDQSWYITEWMESRWRAIQSTL